MANSTIYPYGTGGELPSNIGIINDLVTGGADKALSAEQGGLIGEMLFSIYIDISGLSVTTGIINTADKWDDDGGTCVFLPVTAGSQYKIVANSEHSTNFAFLAQSGWGPASTEPQWATGYSGRVILQPNEAVLVTAPDDAVSLYIRKTSSIGSNMLPSIYKWDTDLVKRIEGEIADIGSEMSTLNLDELNIESVVIGGEKKWGANIGTSLMLPIYSGKRYKVVANDNYNAQISILASQAVGTSGSLVDFATGYDNRIIVSKGTEYSFVAPSNAVAMNMRRTDSQGNIQTPSAVYSDSEQELQIRTFNSSYNPTDTKDVSSKISCIIDGKDNIETFLFFTDPHLTKESRYEIITEFVRDKYISTLQRYYNSCPLDFCICGGDWLDAYHTNEEACSLLGAFDGFMRKLFRNYYPLMGNHDTNPYGGDGGSAYYDDALSYNTVRNLMFRENKNTYYSFDGINTKFYMMNSGMSYCKTMTDQTYGQYIGPRWEQIAWLGNKLLTDDAENSIIAMHIYSNASNETSWFSNETGYRAKGIHEFGKNCKDMAVAYNNRQTITLNGQTYDFSSCSGRVMLIISGHTHWDYVDTSGEIPVIATTCLEGANSSGVYELKPTFDCCVSDLDNAVLYMTRVGVNNSRRIHYIPVSCSESGSVSLTTTFSGEITWQSRDTDIATVSAGVVSGVSSGCVGIIATNGDGEQEYWIIKVSSNV